MKKYLIILLSFLASNVIAQTTNKTNKLDRPKLVVGIVVDQMRWDYFYRYYDRYGEGGLKRMLEEGFRCENTFINYLPSFTAVGHTTIFSGTVPALHGITGNNWLERSTGRNWYCTEDSSVKTVGSTSHAGEMSPRNFKATSITDELRLATNFKAKVVGVSLKDRASILPTGHSPTAAYWLDDETGNFITSTYYMDELPNWVKSFNDRHEAQKLAAKGWSPLYAANTYLESSEDNVSWEGLFAGEKTSVFPHKIDQMVNKDPGIIRTTPFGNTLTLNFAKEAIEGYELGEDEVTDFLTINCASTDYVGHKFGPNSIEVEDTYLRFDQDLAAFFTYLDETVGEGEYLVFLSADHGAAHSVDFLQSHGIPADMWEDKDMVSQLNNLLAKKFKVEDLAYPTINYQIFFDEDKIATNDLDYKAIKESAIDFIRDFPGVMHVVDLENIDKATVPEPIRQAIINGYYHKRSGVIQILLEPGWLPGYSRTGTTHGSWSPYDIHIPLVFMGHGVKKGATYAHVNMTDIAPTIAALLHIQMPSGSIGNVIEEVFENK